jgi:hypothetical protein
MRHKQAFKTISLGILGAGLLVCSGCGAGNSPLSFNNIANSIDGSVGASDWMRPMPDGASTGEKANDGGDQPDPAAIVRQIVYNASISLTVRDLDATKQRIEIVVEQRGGYLAQFSERKISGDQRSGHWVVRVPADSFRNLLVDVAQLGAPESQEIQSQELTEEFVDLQARLKTKQQLEQQMLKIMEQRADKISDALAANQQLSEVRLAIEQIEGRLRKLNDLVALSTVTIDAREESVYAAPPPPSPPPTFAATIGATFDDSMTKMTEFGKGLLLLAVGAAPWLVLLCLVAGPIALVMAIARRWRRQPQAA